MTCDAAMLHTHKAENAEVPTLSVAVENLMILPSSKELVVIGQHLQTSNSSQQSQLDYSS